MKILKKSFGANRIIVASFQLGFILVGSLGYFLLNFLKLAIKIGVSFITILSKYILINFVSDDLN